MARAGESGQPLLMATSEAHTAFDAMLPEYVGNQHRPRRGTAAQVAALVQEMLGVPVQPRVVSAIGQWVEVHRGARQGVSVVAGPSECACTVADARLGQLVTWLEELSHCSLLLWADNPFVRPSTWGDWWCAPMQMGMPWRSLDWTSLRISWRCSLAVGG